MSSAQTFPLANTSYTSKDLEEVFAKLSGGDLCNSCSKATIITRKLTLGIYNTTCSDTINVACAGDVPAMTSITAIDNCSGAITVEGLDAITQGNCDNSFSIVRTWTFFDVCENLSQPHTENIFVTEIADVIILADVSTSNNINENISLDALLPLDVNDGTWINVNNIGGYNAENHTFNPLEIATGNYLFSYTINNGNCLVRYDVQIIIGQVSPCENIIIHNTFTPNSDEFNQFFNIEHIEDTSCYPTNKVEIYNRWGVLVYETKNYDNSTHRFEGLSEGRTTVSQSEKLPTGTYFFVIDWTTTTGEKIIKDGYLYLTR
jgi:gliding motility-associated-like protein